MKHQPDHNPIEHPLKQPFAPSSKIFEVLPNIKTDEMIYIRRGWLALLIVFVFGGSWAALAPLNSATVALGEVVVVSYNKVVQHFEGGLVESIYIDEGSHVKKGDKLISLSSTQASSEFSMVSGQLHEAQGLEARLRAEQFNLSEVVFPKDLLGQLPDSKIQQIINIQQHLFKMRKQTLHSDLTIHQQQIEAHYEQIKGLEALNETLNTRIDLYESEIADLAALFKERFTDKTRLQDMKRNFEELKGERAFNIAEIARLRAQIAETENQKRLTEQRFMQDVLSQLPKVQADINELSFRKLILNDKLTRIDILSPENGIVKGLKVVTLGSVIRPGDTLMEIVPASTDFAVHVKVMPNDINQVNIGQLADVRFSAFNTQFTHVIKGVVIGLSADKFVDERTGLDYFEARIRITPEGIEQMAKDGIFILPGMPVEAMIKTGERTLLAYFIKPFQDMFARSFKEL